MGDRFKWTSGNNSSWYNVWEVTEHNRVTIIESSDDYQIGHSADAEDGGWVWVWSMEYLGNFSKSNNFTTLYNILS